ncbi:MAG: sterol desaturase family protein [Bacteroidia bacterium]|nr:sterol desaturase family protein [Bacteroidia bacterium]
MARAAVSNQGTKVLFSNYLLERLTRTHFLFPVILFYTLCVLMLLLSIFFTSSGFWVLLALFFSGAFAFTLTEYLIHRFLFHFNANTDRKKKIQYLIHGVHHEFPKDKDRLVMPPVASVLLAVFFFSIFWLLMKESVFAFFSGFCFGYSTYLMIHYAVHRCKPPKNYLRILWRHHALHHYREDEGNYSVSFPFWDFFFRSNLKLKSRNDIKEAMNLL